MVAVPLSASAADPKPNVVVADGKPPGSFELVGHDPLMNRGMNAGLAVHGDYAYVGNRTDGLHPNAGVMVVDVSDPSAPEVVGQIGTPNEGNVGETSRELRVLQDEEILVVLNLGSNCSYLIHACSPTSTTVDDNFRFYDISGKNGADPKLIAEYVPSINPHEFYVWKDPKHKGRTLMYMSTPGAGTKLLIADISNVKKVKEIAEWQTLVPDPDTDNRLHSMTVTNDGKRAELAILGGGILEIDTSDVAAGAKKPKIELITPMQSRVHWGNPGAHSAVKFFGRDYVLTTDEVYGYVPGLLSDHGCPWGWVRIVDNRNPSKPKVVSEYKIPANTQEFCDSPTDNDPVRNSTSSFSAHNPTLTKDLALVTWHSGGLQAIDISNPAKPRQAAEFLPEPLPAVTQEDPALSSGHDKVVMWSFPIIQDGLVYVVDLRNGLYILKYKGPHSEQISKTSFLEGNSDYGDAWRMERP